MAGRWVYLYRAIDQFGQVIDVLVSPKRDIAATRRFFTRALEHGPSPTEVITDKAAVYPPVLDEIAPGAWHHTERYANNRNESDHGRNVILLAWSELRGVINRETHDRRISRAEKTSCLLHALPPFWRLK